MQQSTMSREGEVGVMTRRRDRSVELTSAWPGLGVPPAPGEGLTAETAFPEIAPLTLTRAPSTSPLRGLHTVSVFRTLVIGVMMLFSGILLGRSLQLGQAEARTSNPHARAVLPATQIVGPVIESPVALVSRPPLLVVSPGHKYTVQVVAVEKQGAASALAGALSVKGWPAYVQDLSRPVSSPVYRVRVGRFEDRDAAERARQRLEKEEQLAGWIARL